jgi:hypothetical protein
MDRALAQGEPDPAVLAVAQRDVHDALNAPLMLEAIRGERAIFSDLMQAIDQGRVTRQQIAEMEALDTSKVTGWRIIDKWIYRLGVGGFSKHRMAGVVRYCTALTELLKQSPDAPRRSPQAYAAVRARVGIAVWIAVQGFDQVFEADRRQRALLASLAAALAAERFRRDVGCWPDALEELVPAFLTDVPTDPYVLEPLRYRRLADGVVIYSVGPDSLDSGGEVRAPPGVNRLPADIGVRLWDVAHRRQPPEPPD